jgi:hypothetical protein
VLGSCPVSKLRAIVQHSWSLQERVLVLAKATLPGQISLQSMALLEDRVSVHQGIPQRFGTPFTLGPDGLARFEPVIDPVDLDKRRDSAGMPPLAQYVCVLESAGMHVDRATLPPVPPP